MFEDKTLICRDCGGEFIFTANEQQFYADKGFQNEPGRCPACRSQRRSSQGGERQMYEATCASCGGVARVPFQPRNDKPVYCSACFAASRQG